MVFMTFRGVDPFVKVVPDRPSPTVVYWTFLSLLHVVNFQDKDWLSCFCDGICLLYVPHLIYN